MLWAMDAPVAGHDYPRTLREFDAWFPDEAACLDYLIRLRWPGGFACPVCGERRFWRMSKGRNLRCAGCRADASITAGTIFADTRLPLAIWFAAAWYATGTKHGVSALSLQRVLGLGSYEAAWALLHKLRHAMVRPGRDRLAGEVEADETYVGGVATGKRGRGAAKKAIVEVAVEKRGAGMGRCRLVRVPDISGESLLAAIEESVEPGAVVYTDHYGGYNGLGAAGYIHYPTAISSSGDPAHVVMPRVHRIASLLKRWLLGTHQGAVRPQHLDDYLSEFTFRFNRRGSSHRGLLFYRLLEQAVQLDHVPASAIKASGRSADRYEGALAG
jgi:transposase-like protein